MIYRKIGGIHWFSIWRLRIAFCLSQQGAQRPLTKRPLTPRRGTVQRAKRALTQGHTQRNVDTELHNGINEVLRQRYSVHSPF